MYLEFTAEQRNLRCQLREYFKELVEDVEGSAVAEPTYTQYIRRMGHGARLAGPRMARGVRRSSRAIDQMIFVEESHWAGVPLHPRP